MILADVLWPTLAGASVSALLATVLWCRRLRARLANSEATLAASEAEWMQALDFAEDAMYLVDLDDRLVRGNRKFFEFIGKRPEQAVGQDLMTLVHGAPEDQPCPVCSARRAHRDAAFVKEADDPINRLGRPIEVIVRMRRDREGTATGVLMVIRDLTRQREAERLQGESRERLQVILHSIGEGVITTDVAGHIEYFNPAAERLTGWGTNEVLGRPLHEVFPLLDEGGGALATDPVAACLAEGAVTQSPRDNTLLRRDGTEAAVEHTAAPLRDNAGRVFGVVLAFRDVTTVRGLARQLTYQASHDALTGLINRRAFEARLEHALQSARSEGRRHVLCYLDLDQFKVVNDTCGHGAGDQLLKQLTALLKGRLREHDVIARLGGDEFGVLLESCSLDNAREIGEALRTLVREFRFAWQDKTFELGVSIGMVPITAEAASVAELLSAADAACYVAKDLGRNRVHVYEPDDAALAKHQSELAWVHRISQAIAQGRLHLEAQPLAALRDPAAPSYCEVLVRLTDDEGRLVEPAAFIPAAERYNLMAQIDRWTLQTVLSALRDAPAAAGCTRVALNISGSSLSQPGFLDFVVQEITRCGPLAQRLCFEITETAAIANFTQAQAFMHKLRGLGCRFGLDDFGSGLSSFTYLKHLPVDYLKIDGSFVRDMAQDAVDYAMVESINQLGHVMGIQTIAEHVESDEVLALLRRLGVDYAQGFAVARPAPFMGVLHRKAPAPQGLD